MVVGIHSKSKPAQGQRKIKVDKVILHPDYDGSSETEDNDIMLLRLSEKVDFTHGSNVPPHAHIVTRLRRENIFRVDAAQ